MSHPFAASTRTTYCGRALTANPSNRVVVFVASAQQVLPAYRNFFEQANPDPLIALCRKVISGLNKNANLPGLYLPSTEEYREAIGVLDGSLIPDRGTDCGLQDGIHRRLSLGQRDVRYTLGEMVITGLCIPHDRGVNPVLDMMNTPLREYLYKRSDWIENFFAGSREIRGRPLEILMCCYYPEYFSKVDVIEFRKRLIEIPSPKRTKATKKELEKASRNTREWLEKFHPFRQKLTPQEKEKVYQETMDFAAEQGSKAGDDYEQLARMLDLAIEDPNLTILELLY